jgi:NADP-dependent 3-hydroxy acid dehydrogenase YdfG
MFNNAGIGVNKPLLDQEPADCDRVVKVNQYGVSYGILLRPEWAALLMSASTVIVTVNALLIGRVGVARTTPAAAT